MPNPLCHFELMTTDPKRCQDFYGNVFDWQFDHDTMPGYSLISVGGEVTGAAFTKPVDAPGVCMNTYFQVADIDATLAKVTDRGGNVLVPKTEIPGTGHMAMFTDPEGVPIGIMQPTA